MAETSVVQPAASPYAPGWIDHFTNWVDSLNMPSWGFYVVLAAILGGVQIIIQWDGTALYPFPLVYVLTPLYNLALIHYLDKIAGQALNRFRPMLSISDAEYADLHYRLTTLPARPALLATLIGALYGVWTLDWVSYESQIRDLHFADTPLSMHFVHGLAIPIWAVMGVLVYHTLHQLRVVQIIYDRCSSINLYSTRPLYAFSDLSARTAVGITLMIYSWYLVAPSLFASGSSVLHLILLSALALITFAVPLQGARRLLVEAKDRLLNDNGERLRSTLADLHHQIDSGERADMDNLNKALSSLELEHTTLERISTWPWKAETAQAVAAALLFPVVVWLMQWILERLLGG
jgi:hypothetical protein